jgi:O-antigen ligase
MANQPPQAIQRRQIANHLTKLLTQTFIVLSLGYLILVGGGVTSQTSWQWQLATWILVVSVCVIWFGWRVVWRRAAWPVTKLEGVLLVALLSASLSWVASPDWRMGAARLFQLAGFVGLFYIAVDCFDASPLGEMVIDALILVSGLALALALLETYAYYQSRWELLFTAEWYRPVTLLGHPNLLMGLANLVLPFVLLAWSRYRNAWSRTGLLLWGLCYVAVIPFASSRGAMLGLAAMIAVVLLTLAYRRQSALSAQVVQRLRRGLIWLAGLGAVVITALIGLFLYQSSSPSHGGLLSRFIIWQIAAQIIANNFWLGAGPGRFGFEAARYGSVPPGFWPIHAHSVFFQTFGEFGLIGIIALVALLTRIGWLIWTALQQTSGLPRWQILAGGFALFGYGLQNLVDDQTHVIAAMIPLMLVGALVFAARPVIRGQRSMLWVAMPILVVSAVQGQWLKAYYSFDQGRQQYQLGQWATALAYIQQAQTEDSGLAFYDTSAGLVAARLGDWSLAEMDFEKALQHEDGLAMTYVNLGLVRWAGGDRSGGLDAVQQAATIAPGSETIQYILGQMAETQSQPTLAEESYKVTLMLRPDWYSHTFWQTTPLRQRVWSAMVGTEGLGFETVDKVEQDIQGGNLEAARETLDNYFAVGDLWQPRKVRMILLDGDVRMQMGETEQAMQLYKNALASLANPSVEGSGSAFWTRYGIWLYEREPLKIDLVPGWPLLDYRPLEDLPRFEKLLDWSEANWSCAATRSIAQAIIDLQPEHTPARSALAAECP